MDRRPPAINESPAGDKTDRAFECLTEEKQFDATNSIRLADGWELNPAAIESRVYPLSREAGQYLVLLYSQCQANCFSRLDRLHHTACAAWAGSPLNRKDHRWPPVRNRTCFPPNPLYFEGVVSLYNSRRAS
nr:MAG TPA: hypothetical protein [Caudoviricetes sp.]